MPVLAPDVVDHLGAPVLAEVDIDVGELGTIRIGEPLEEQAVAHRAGVGESQHIADHGAHARAARVGRNALAPAPRDEVPDDQEVSRDVLVGQNFEFALEADDLFFLGTATLRVALPRPHAERGGIHIQAIAPDKTRLGDHAKGGVALVFRLGLQLLPLGLVGPGRNCERDNLERGAVGVVPRRGIAAEPLIRDPGQVLLCGQFHAHHRRIAHAKRELHLPGTTLGDLHRVLDRAAPDLAVFPLEKFTHLLRALDVELRRVVHPIRVVLHLAHRDADERVVGVVILGTQEVCIVVAHQREAEVRRQLDQVLVDRVLVRDVVLEFDEEAIRAERRKPPVFLFFAGLTVRSGGLRPSALIERLGVPERALLGLVPVLFVAAALEGQQVLADLAAEVPVDGDEPFGMFLQQLPINPRLEVEPAQIRLGAEVQQVAPTRVVLRQQHKVIAPVGDARERAIRARPARRRDIRLHTQDREYALLLACEVEGGRAEEVAVIRHGHGVHAQLFDALHELVNPVAAVEQGILAVQMQMDKPPLNSGRRGVDGWRTSVCHGLGRNTELLLQVVGGTTPRGAIRFGPRFG